MRYSELDKLAEENEWGKTRDDDYWLLYIKDNINIEICKHRIDNDILLWAETSEGEINLNDELDFINACIELGNTPLADRESEKRFIIPLPGLVTTDGKQQYLTHKDCKFFASRRDETLRQTWKEEHLEIIPEEYRQFAEEFDERKELEDDYKK